MILRISTTVKLRPEKLTLVRTGSHLVLEVGMFEYALGAEHLVAVFTEKFDLLVLVHVAELKHRAFRRRFALLSARFLGVHGQGSEDGVVHREGVN
jgi:hypothetical protein